MAERIKRAKPHYIKAKDGPFHGLKIRQEGSLPNGTLLKPNDEIEIAGGVYRLYEREGHRWYQWTT